MYTFAVQIHRGISQLSGRCGCWGISVLIVINGLVVGTRANGFESGGTTTAASAIVAEIVLL